MTRLYTVMGPGNIQGLGINGPLTEPTYIPLQYINAMVRTGRVIYQHNPYNLKEKVQVTQENTSSIVFHPTKAKEEETPVEIHGANYTTEETETQIENTNDQVQSYNSNSHHSKKKNKHKYHQDNNNNETQTEVNITDVIETEPVTSGDAFENVNFSAD